MSDHGGTAVVVGASMGGLVAARALTETYGRVVLVDRDDLPATAAHRRCVPQSKQLHVLLARGREELDDLFPGLSDELVALGAALVDLQDDVHWYNDGYRMRRAPSPLKAVGISRPLLEHAVRARVLALPGVELLSPAEVLGPTATPDGRRVTGLRVLSGPDGETELPADLVVDAAGRASRTPVWLEQLGYRRATEEEVPVGITYVTRIYKRESHHLDGLSGAFAGIEPSTRRGGIVAVQEGDRFAVVLSGMLGEEPPTDDDGMAAFADTLAAPQVAEVIRTGVPLDDPVSMRFPASRRRHYEKLRRFPEGLLVTGDAVCSFNPIYGQGMTVATLEAQLLRRLLREGTSPDQLARRFFAGAAALIENPWSIAVGNDLRFPDVPGRRTARVRLVNAYVARLHRAAVNDPALGDAFLRVLNLIDPPTRLLAPTTLARVLLRA